MSDLFGDSSSDDEGNGGNNVEVNYYGNIVSTDFRDSASSSDDEDENYNDGRYEDEVNFNYILQKVKANDRHYDFLDGSGRSNFIQNMITNENWEEFGTDISNNTHLRQLTLHTGALDDLKMTFLFRGLTGSSSLRRLTLDRNELSAVGVRSMVPFLKSSTTLVRLTLRDNKLQSEGFNALLRAMRNSPIRELYCNKCGIASIEIRCIPKHLKWLYLSGNSIDVDGCRGLVKLLQGEDAALTELYLRNNMIDDEGVEILVNALQNNTTLKKLTLKGNKRISRHGNIMLLKLVNGISSIEATMRSNHTLISLRGTDYTIQKVINTATFINRNYASSPEVAGKRKMIEMQLRSKRRAQLAELQGVHQSVYSEINPLHLPEVLSKISRWNGKTELYAALKSSLLELISTVDRKACILLHRDSYSAKLAELNAEAARLSTRVAQLNDQLVVIESVEGNAVNVGGEEFPSSKRRRQA